MHVHLHMQQIPHAEVSGGEVMTNALRLTNSKRAPSHLQCFLAVQ